MAPQFSSVSFSSSGNYGFQKIEQKKPWTAVIIDEVYRNICGDLDTVLKRDIFKKLVEASAFKALESWWDNQTKPKVIFFAHALILLLSNSTAIHSFIWLIHE